MAEELEDLFCRLFLNFESLIVEATEDGLRSGNGVLVVKTFSPREDSHWAVVGDPRRISSVVAENGRPVQIDARIGRYDRTDVGRTPRLGGIVYTFADEKEDEIFSAFLAERFRL